VLVADIHKGELYSQVINISLEIGNMNAILEKVIDKLNSNINTLSRFIRFEGRILSR
jgi:hypothetical protein